MTAVLEKGGHFSGINRKVQIKPTAWTVVSGRGGSTTSVGSASRPVSPKPTAASPHPAATTPAPAASAAHVAQIATPAAPLVVGSVTADGEDDGRQVASEALLVLKWGGELTEDGRAQAESLGHRYRVELYPGEDGLLRLHSTYRHDLKIYASDEGRVQMTAAAFAKAGAAWVPDLASTVVLLTQRALLLHAAVWGVRTGPGLPGSGG